jgi:hypothetical protein
VLGTKPYRSWVRDPQPIQQEYVIIRVLAPVLAQTGTDPPGDGCGTRVLAQQQRSTHNCMCRATPQHPAPLRRAARIAPHARRNLPAWASFADADWQQGQAGAPFHALILAAHHPNSEEQTR